MKPLKISPIMLVWWVCLLATGVMLAYERTTGAELHWAIVWAPMWVPSALIALLVVGVIALSFASDFRWPAKHDD